MAVSTITLSKLVSAAGNVGVYLRRTDGPGHLYVWTTDRDEVVYVGKSESKSRVKDEAGWAAKDPKKQIYSGIVTLLRVNEAQPISLTYAARDYAASKWRALRSSWEGSAFLELDHQLAARAPSLLEVEELLVRIAVRYGAPLGNSQFHSQWENPIDRVPDTLAVLAVDADPLFTVPEARMR